MKVSIKVTELVCLKVVSENGTSTAIPLEPTYNPNGGKAGFEVFVHEAKDLTVIRHISSGDCLVMDDKGTIVDNETLVNKCF